MLQNAKVTAFTISELLKEKLKEKTGGGKIPPDCHLCNATFQTCLF